MNKIDVIGLGPGNPLYILPIALITLQASDVIIGGERNLETVDISGKESIIIKNNLHDIVQYIMDNYSKKKIAVIASGDPGFYSILAYLKKYFPNDVLNVIPGISSFQYMCAKCAISWEDAYLGSLHGREADVPDIVKRFSTALFLTSNENSYQHIARTLSENGYGEKTMYVGTNLSYDNEYIFKDKAKNLAESKENYNLSVVVIVDE